MAKKNNEIKHKGNKRDYKNKELTKKNSGKYLYLYLF